MLERITAVFCPAAPETFCLIAGQYDNAESYAMLQAGYTEDPERLRIINHASGHRPPADALNEGYAFLERAGPNITGKDRIWKQ